MPPGSTIRSGRPGARVDDVGDLPVWCRDLFDIAERVVAQHRTSTAWAGDRQRLTVGVVVGGGDPPAGVGFLTHSTIGVNAVDRRRADGIAIGGVRAVAVGTQVILEPPPRPHPVHPGLNGHPPEVVVGVPILHTQGVTPPRHTGSVVVAEIRCAADRIGRRREVAVVVVEGAELLIDG